MIRVASSTRREQRRRGRRDDRRLERRRLRSRRLDHWRRPLRVPARRRLQARPLAPERPLEQRDQQPRDRHHQHDRLPAGDRPGPPGQRAGSGTRLRARNENRGVPASGASQPQSIGAVLPAAGLALVAAPAPRRPPRGRCARVRRLRFGATGSGTAATDGRATPAGRVRSAEACTSTGSLPRFVQRVLTEPGRGSSCSAPCCAR